MRQPTSRPGGGRGGRATRCPHRGGRELMAANMDRNLLNGGESSRHTGLVSTNFMGRAYRERKMRFRAKDYHTDRLCQVPMGAHALTQQAWVGPTLEHTSKIVLQAYVNDCGLIQLLLVHDLTPLGSMKSFGQLHPMFGGAAHRTANVLHFTDSAPYCITRRAAS
jgi:hypothetical protein